ncbi:hypothetical protein ACA910_018546 [Epithemia clementina (nom. ined.)]
MALTPTKSTSGVTSAGGAGAGSAPTPSSSHSAGGAGVAAGAGDAANGGPAAHIWEETNVGHTWESAVVEDEQGRIIVQGGHRDSLTALLRQRRRRLEQNDSSLRHCRLRRDMIRYLYILLDASRWMNEKDPTLPPGTRLEVTIDLLLEFCQAYFDENPLSHLGIILVRNGEAELLTPLSGNPQPHKRALQSVVDYVTSSSSSGGGPNNNGGEFSLQNGLEVAGRSLGHQPRHGSREIVVIAAALSTCDPGCNLVTDTLPRLQQARIRVSNFALCAEMYVSRKLATETGGCCGVCLDRTQFREWLLNQTVPPPTLLVANGDGNDGTLAAASCEMVLMGFPSRTVNAVPSLVHAAAGGSRGSGITTPGSLGGGGGGDGGSVWFARTAYTCPQCQAMNAELPTECAVCGLKLVLAPHLARSFHHLFPVPPFAEVVALQDHGSGDDNDNPDKRSKSALISSASSAVTSSSQVLMSKILTSDLIIDSKLDDTCCFACTRPLVNITDVASTNNNNNNAPSLSPPKVEWLRFACPECDNVFCFDCDAFLHERLHNCPGCLAVS